MKIGFISDRQSHLGQDVLNLLKSVDEIWHAGDLGIIEIFDRLGFIALVRDDYSKIDYDKVREVSLQ